MSDSRLDVVIDVDAPSVTCCCFGGEDPGTLVVCTTRDGLANDELDAHLVSRAPVRSMIDHRPDRTLDTDETATR